MSIGYEEKTHKGTPNNQYTHGFKRDLSSASMGVKEGGQRGLTSQGDKLHAMQKDYWEDLNGDVEKIKNFYTSEVSNMEGVLTYQGENWRTKHQGGGTELRSL